MARLLVTHMLLSHRGGEDWYESAPADPACARPAMTDRHAAVELRRSLEAVRDEIRAEFALQDGFWLAFVFGAEAPEVAELVARSTDLARIEVQRVEVARFGGPDDVVPVLRTLLTPHGPDVAATWVTDAGTGAGERERAWTELLQRLRRHPAVARRARPRPRQLHRVLGNRPRHPHHDR